MEAARRGEVDAVLVWKLDRFGRSALDVLTNTRELKGRWVRFVVTTQGTDVRPGGDAISRLILTTLAGVAELERDLIRERTRLGLERARVRCARVGRLRNAEPATIRRRVLGALTRSTRAQPAEPHDGGPRRRLWTALARGDRDELEKEAWKAGYR